MEIYRGLRLKEHIRNDILVDGYGKRDCYKLLERYLSGGSTRKACCLFGLRRTGKTVMMAQAVEDIGDHDSCLYIECSREDDAGDLYAAIGAEADAKNVFIDEATFADGFVDTCSVLADKFAMKGTKVVIAGTDSLGLKIAMGGELYDRAVTIHTSYVPFREFTRLLGKDLDEYIMYGGTLTDGREIYNLHDGAPLSAYANEAIVNNIVHSLEQWDNGNRFGRLLEAYERGDLPTYIRKVLAYETQEFTADVINRTFKSNDLGHLKDLLRKHGIDVKPIKEAEKELTRLIRENMGIREPLGGLADGQTVAEIRRYLMDIEVMHEPEGAGMPIFTQPGMRYCQARQFAKAFVGSGLLSGYDLRSRSEIFEKIDSNIKGRMLEGIILADISKDPALADRYGAAKYRNDAPGSANFQKECDIVLFDKRSFVNIGIEVKHSPVVAIGQAKHLLSESFVREIEEKVVGGPMASRCVAYRGPSMAVDFGGSTVLYVNASDFLSRKVTVDDLMDPARFKERFPCMAWDHGKGCLGGPAKAPPAVPGTAQPGHAKGTFTLLCGIPFSGKTKECGRILKSDPTAVAVRLSDLREKAGLHEETAQYMVREKIRELLSSGKHVVYDAVNLTRATRDTFLAIAREEGACAEMVVAKRDFGDVLALAAKARFDIDALHAMAYTFGNGPDAGEMGRWDSCRDVREISRGRRGAEER